MYQVIDENKKRETIKQTNGATCFRGGNFLLKSAKMLSIKMYEENIY